LGYEWGARQKNCEGVMPKEHPAKYEHQTYVCNREHDGSNCMFCDGGLFICNICGGAEASAPTECPGRLMTHYEQDMVQNQTLDFMAGVWVPLRRYFYFDRKGECFLVKGWVSDEPAISYAKKLDNRSSVRLHSIKGIVIWEEENG
jgi:hypothetical protein